MTRKLAFVFVTAPIALALAGCAHHAAPARTASSAHHAPRKHVTKAHAHAKAHSPAAQAQAHAQAKTQDTAPPAEEHPVWAGELD